MSKLCQGSQGHMISINHHALPLPVESPWPATIPQGLVTLIHSADWLFPPSLAPPCIPAGCLAEGPFVSWTSTEIYTTRSKINICTIDLKSIQHRSCIMFIILCKMELCITSDLPTPKCFCQNSTQPVSNLYIFRFFTRLLCGSKPVSLVSCILPTLCWFRTTGSIKFKPAIITRKMANFGKALNAKLMFIGFKNFFDQSGPAVQFSPRNWWKRCTHLMQICKQTIMLSTLNDRLR